MGEWLEQNAGELSAAKEGERTASHADFVRRNADEFI